MRESNNDLTSRDSDFRGGTFGGGWPLSEHECLRAIWLALETGMGILANENSN